MCWPATSAIAALVYALPAPGPAPRFGVRVGCGRDGSEGGEDEQGRAGRADIKVGWIPIVRELLCGGVKRREGLGSGLPLGSGFCVRCVKRREEKADRDMTRHDLA